MAGVLDRDHALWMVQGAASILVASRSESLEPSLGQGLGCRIAADLAAVTVLLLEAQNESLVADLRRCGIIAVSFTNSASTRSLQLKGSDANIVPLESADGERMTTHAGALAREWGASGQPEAFTRALLFREPSAVILAIRFTPYVAFDQTPGPRAGMPLLGFT
jgi:hypothetical protein